MSSFEVKTETFPQQGDDVNHYLSLLFTPGSASYDQLKYELQREYRFNGSPEVTSIKFDKGQLDANKGSFRVILDINFTFGCEDVQTDKHDQTSDWTFDVDREKQLIRFYSSPYAEARSTADEF
ncbi:hypothetical protein MUY27_15100 [Mucilaginibacter sp. RS28]|uniref:Uncharacterized protein n=1 Tax=Mucilaginibacter straminoryzae TaxID=2932774 RepID=A0A9X1X4T8_9SPHI|nr:hypothetical protein [Mucilaginibacter straminoryzae]MCJ8211044.1 hypothetical protein [Mucilaginibacter straminoryzae]